MATGWVGDDLQDLGCLFGSQRRLPRQQPGRVAQCDLKRAQGLCVATQSPGPASAGGGTHPGRSRPIRAPSRATVAFFKDTTCTSTTPGGSRLHLSEMLASPPGGRKSPSGRGAQNGSQPDEMPRRRSRLILTPQEAESVAPVQEQQPRVWARGGGQAGEPSIPNLPGPEH